MDKLKRLTKYIESQKQRLEQGKLTPAKKEWLIRDIKRTEADMARLRLS